MKISAVIPTIDGREKLLEQTIESLADTASGHEVELVVVKNSPTGGQGWNEGAEAATGTHLWFGADDLTFFPGWLDAVVEFTRDGGYSCPRILRPNGSVEACGTIGQGGPIEAEVEDGLPCNASQFPFVLRETWDEIGPSLPVHYFADDYLGFRARVAGLDVRLVRAYSLVHHDGFVGHKRHAGRYWDDRQRFLQKIAEEHRLVEVAA